MYSVARIAAILQQYRIWSSQALDRGHALTRVCIDLSEWLGASALRAPALISKQKLEPEQGRLLLCIIIRALQCWAPRARRSQGTLGIRSGLPWMGSSDVRRHCRCTCHTAFGLLWYAVASTLRARAVMRRSVGTRAKASAGEQTGLGDREAAPPAHGANQRPTARARPTKRDAALPFGGFCGRRHTVVRPIASAPRLERTIVARACRHRTRCRYEI